MARRSDNTLQILLALGVGGYFAWPYIGKYVIGGAKKAAEVIAPPAAAATPPKATSRVPAVKAPAEKPIIYGDKSKPRGIRNNNPGNIRKSANNWRGKIGNDGAFEVFDSPKNGIRAAMVLLQTYFSKYGLDTVAKIAARWAPTADNNNVPAYITVVNKQGGLPTGAILDLRDRSTMFKLIRGITAKENGVSYVNYYPDAVLQAAWDAI